MISKFIWVVTLWLLFHHLEGAPVTKTSFILNEGISGYFKRPLDGNDVDDNHTKNQTTYQKDDKYITKHLVAASGRLTRMFRRRNTVALHELNKFLPLCTRTLSDYCQFIQSDPDHAMNVTPCNKSWTTPSVSTTVTSTKNRTQLVNLLKTTANKIYNISFTILLQEACGRPPCGKEQYLAFANKSIEQLTANYDLFNKNIHLVAVLEDAIYKLSGSALAKRTVPPASELMNINLGDTGSVVQVLRTSCNEIHYQVSV